MEVTFRFLMLEFVLVREILVFVTQLPLELEPVMQDTLSMFKAELEIDAA